MQPKDLLWILFAIIIAPISFLFPIIRRAKLTFVCPICGEVFRPRWNNYLRLIINVPSEDREKCILKCPSCKNVNIMNEK